MLEKKKSEYARRFRDELDDFSFEEVELVKLPSSVPYLAGTTGIAVLGGIFGGILPETSFITNMIGRVPTVLVSSFFFGGLGGGVLRGLWQSKTHSANEGAAQKYTAQLKLLHDALLKICQQADKDQ